MMQSNLHVKHAIQTYETKYFAQVKASIVAQRKEPSMLTNRFLTSDEITAALKETE